MRVPDRGATDLAGVASAQTNGDRGGSRGIGCRRHRGARPGAERRRLASTHADELDARHHAARVDASGVLDGEPPADHASGVLPAELDRDDVAGARADVLAAAAHVDPADPAAHHPVAPVDDDRAAVLPVDHDDDDVADPDDPVAVGSHP